MTWLVIAFVLIVLVVLVAAVLARQPAGDFPYSRQPTLFSPAERSFLGVLDQAVGEQYRIFGKVRVADVVSPRKGMKRPDWQRAFNRINAKHFDFILCDPKDLSVIAAIELDDSSHDSGRGQQRDDFLNRACEAADLPLIRVRASNTYNVADIKQQIQEAITPEQESSPAIEAQPSSQNPPSTTPPCPKCGAEMARRTAKSGKHAGQVFWGCSTFPKCRGAMKFQD